MVSLIMQSSPVLPCGLQQRARWLLALTAALFVLGGCSRGDTAEPVPDLIKPLPSDWRVVEPDQPWTPVNIDGDPENEFLLLYTYDNSAAASPEGPTGASIYDLQNNTELGNLPNQTSPTFRAYRLQPNYWSGSDARFIAESGKHTSVTVTTVPRVADEAISELPDNVLPVVAAQPEYESTARTQLNQELMIKGGSTTLTFVWWRNMRDGYGTATIHAAGGFRNSRSPNDDPRFPPDVISGLDPLRDRSELCNRIDYTRTIVAESPRDIQYIGTVRGLDFCRGTRTDHPFYPEAVVLTYLQALVDPAVDEGAWTAFAPGDEPPAEFFAGLGAQRLVYGLFAPRTIPYLGSQVRYSATVCAEILDTSDDSRQAYTFHLTHALPAYEEERTDEWRISAVKLVPAPDGGPPADCKEIVKQGTPGRVVYP